MKFDLFSIIIIVVVVLVGGYAAYIQIKTKRYGIETDAVVTNVRESWDNDDESGSLCYTYTIEYQNYEGITITAALGGMSDKIRNLAVGDRIRIKYLKNKQDYPILVK